MRAYHAVGFVSEEEERKVKDNIQHQSIDSHSEHVANGWCFPFLPVTVEEQTVRAQDLKGTLKTLLLEAMRFPCASQLSSYFDM